MSDKLNKMLNKLDIWKNIFNFAAGIPYKES